MNELLWQEESVIFNNHQHENKSYDLIRGIKICVSDSTMAFESAEKKPRSP